MTKRGNAAGADNAANDAASPEEYRALKNECEVFLERLKGLASDHARYVLAPRVLAEKRRRAGDPAASPFDYDCRCELSRKDQLPICDGRRDNCKFAHRPRPPGPRILDNHVMHAVHRAEQRKVQENLMRLLESNEIAEFKAEIDRLDRAVEAAFRRIEVSTGASLPRNRTGWL